MIQESILERIDKIDERELVSEAEVLSAMADSYLKACMIMESAEEPDAVCVSIFTESDTEADTEADSDDDKKKGNIIKNIGGRAKEVLKKIWDAIVGLWNKIVDKFKKFFRKIRNKNMANMIAKNGDAAKIYKDAGCKVKAVDGGAYEVYWPTYDFAKIDEILKDMINKADDSAFDLGYLDKAGFEVSIGKIKAIINHKVYSTDPLQYSENAIESLNKFKDTIVGYRKMIVEELDKLNDVKEKKSYEKYMKVSNGILKNTNDLIGDLNKAALGIDEIYNNTQAALKNSAKNES
jgi:hypothetical protein